MNRSLLWIILLLATLSACRDEQAIAPVTVADLPGLWLVTGEKSLTDGYLHADDEGISTRWAIDNPFGGSLHVTAIEFNDDFTFFWNTDVVQDRDHFLKIWSLLPEDQRNTYGMNAGGAVVLNTPFEYVGVVKVATLNFKTCLLDNGQLRLKNEIVELTLSRAK